jgi:hypothetical protein
MEPPKRISDFVEGELIERKFLRAALTERCQRLVEGAL